MKCKTVEEVYSEYQNICRETLGGKEYLSVLKTDCYNESGIHPIPKPIVPLLIPHCDRIQVFEIDINTIGAALKKDYMKHEKVFLQHQDLIRFDARERKYDIIFDFSTIDHMDYKDAVIVLRKYRQALKAGGILSLVVWLNEERSYQQGQQYFFWKRFFDDIICKLFRLQKKVHLWTLKQDELWYYKMIRRRSLLF